MKSRVLSFLLLVLLPLAARGQKRVVVNVPKDTMTVGDSVIATATAYNPGGNVVSNATITWFASPGVGSNTCALTRNIGTYHQQAWIKVLVTGRCQIVGSWNQQNVRGIDYVQVVAAPPPIPVDTLPTWQRVGCILQVPERIDSIAVVVTPADSFRLYYFRVGGRNYQQKVDSTAFLFHIQQPQPIVDSLPACPP